MKHYWIKMGNLLLLISIMGCAPTHKIIYKEPVWVKNWTTSNSLCADGILINQANSGCYDIHMEQDASGVRWLKCKLPDDYPKAKLNYWNSNIFIILPRPIEADSKKNPSKKLPYSVQPICGDAEVIAGKIIELKFSNSK